MIPITLRSIYVPFVGSVDTVANTFEARVDVDMEWPTSEAELARFAASEDTYRPDFVPDLVVQNAAKLDMRRVATANLNVFTIKNEQNLVRVRCEGTFIEEYVRGSAP